MARKLRGPKLARSDIISVRIDSKLMLAVRLAAATERRTVSSFLEKALDDAVRKIEVSISEDEEPMNALQVAEHVWDPVEAKRLMYLALHHPHLLSNEEEVLWHLIWYDTAFSEPRPKALLYDPAAYVKWDVVQKHWEGLRRVAAGELGREALPSGETIGESKLALRRAQ